MEVKIREIFKLLDRVFCFIFWVTTIELVSTKNYGSVCISLLIAILFTEICLYKKEQ